MMNILFMCVANSARSQMAEGLARHLFREKIKIESAGSAPKAVNPFAIEVMKEIGIDISNHKSKSIDDLDLHFISNLNYVITLCAEEVCPIIVSKAERIHWPIPDPAIVMGSNEEMLNAFRKARDKILEKLETFILK